MDKISGSISRCSSRKVFMLVLVTCVMVTFVIIRLYPEHNNFFHPSYDTMYNMDRRSTFKLVEGTRFWMYNHTAVISTNLTGHQGILVIGFIQEPREEYEVETGIECKITFAGDQNETVSGFIEKVPPFPGDTFKYSPAYCWCIPQSKLQPIKVELRGRVEENKNVKMRRGSTSLKAAKDKSGTTVYIEREVSGTTGNFALCVPYVYKYESVASFVEIMELYRLQGVENIIMHGYGNISKDVIKVINYYRNIGYIDMLPWNIDTWKSRYGSKKGKKHNVLRADGLHLIRGNCLHRYRNKYKYMMFTDLDEFIIPSKDDIPSDLLGMFNIIQKIYNVGNMSEVCEFYFKWTTFCVDGGAIHKRKSSEGLFTDQFITRAPPLERSKVITSTRNAYSMATHSARTCRAKSTKVKVDEKFIKCHHYRYRPVITQLGDSRGCTVKDKSVYRYRKKLKRQTQMVLNAVINN